MVAWGPQAYRIKLANATMSAESIFMYMMLTGLLFIPVAVLLTDFSRPVNLGWSGPGDRSRHPDAECHRRTVTGVRIPLRQGDRGVAPGERGRTLTDSADSAGHRRFAARSYKETPIMLALSGALLLSLQTD